MNQNRPQKRPATKFAGEVEDGDGKKIKFCFEVPRSTQRISFKIEHEPEVWQIFFRTLTGKNFELEVEPSNTIGDVKNKIRAKEGIPREDQRLFVDKLECKDDETALMDCDVKNGSTLNLVLRLRAG